MTAPFGNHNAQALASRLIDKILPIVAADIEALKRERAGEEAVMRACRDVGAAVDRLDQMKFGPGELPARKSLERKARALARAMERYRDARK
ncbi:hypothetical protein [Mesorhizobium sp.]|uniref:hypothetical protein n=1 Tax=Mesorhizobium sp. TaxID=1871066 RepID=UPI000FE95AB4|nr:hypothetical protein [Mesorhizobium sp.]RWC58896.1 MAG: hypothetical protein EOS56_18475 [Mesorhizobium sp.]RWC66508.1 MAG: hypothetical protein EOS29_03830 [Mesorhizobium sp.]